MPVAAAIAPAIASTAGGLIGNLAGAGDRERAQQMQLAALKNFMDLQAPSIEQQMISPEKYQVAGKLTPEAEELFQQGPSEFKGISTDPRLRQAQLNALTQLQQISGGQLRPEDQAVLAQIQNQAAQQNKAAQESILQNMQERGIAGGGAELAAKLSAAQSAYNRAAQGGLDVAGQASQRALQAIGQAGNLGGQMESQQFNEQAQIAAAQDLINRYNALNQQQVSGQNVAARNAAQAANLQNLQNIMNQNTGVSNQAQLYNKNLYQQQFENQMSRARGLSGQQEQTAGMYNQAAQRAADMGKGIGGSISQAIGGMGTGGLFGGAPKPAWQQQKEDYEQSQMQGPALR